MIQEKQWLSVKAFCDRFGLGKNLVYEAVREGRLRAVRIRGRVLVAANALDVIADARSTEPTASSV